MPIHYLWRYKRVTNSALDFSRVITKYEERRRKLFVTTNLSKRYAELIATSSAWYLYFAKILQVPGTTFTNGKSCQNDVLT